MLSPKELWVSLGASLCSRRDPHRLRVELHGLMSSEFVTANCFYRRLAIEEAGGFDESFTMAWREDSDCSLPCLA